ncbi:GumC family protein [Devosia sp.]|uniref:GumC family protein n=1 Tax=Devosia sp. TaxID=1871048 RepID=UPI003A9276FD
MNNGIDLPAIFGTLTRRKWLVLGSLGAGLLLALVAALVLRPVYTATALVLVDPRPKDLLANTAPGSSTSDLLRIDSEVELVASEPNLISVMEQLELANDPDFVHDTSVLVAMAEFLAPPTFAAQIDPETALALSRLQSAVHIDRRPATYLIAIAAGSTDPERAASIANALAEVHIAAQLRSKIAGVEAQRDIIETRVAEAGIAVAQSEAAFSSYIARNLTEISSEIGRPDLVDLRRRSDRLLASRSAAAERAEMVGEALARRDWSALALRLDSAAVNDLEQTRRQLSTLLAETSEAANRAELQTRLDAIEREFSKFANGALADLRAEIAGLQRSAAEIDARLRAEVLDADLPAATVAALYELQQAAATNRRHYQTLLSRQAELDTQAALQVADSRLATRAVPPATPSFPNTPVLLLVGLAAGLAAGIALALLRERLSGGFVDETSMEDALGLPCLVSIPTRPPCRTGETIADQIVTAPLSAFSESLSRLRVAADQLLRARLHVPGGSVIAITSTASGEGKTSLALALARSYAAAGRATLLIDCDLRKPSIHQYLRMDPLLGLIDFLTPYGRVNDLHYILSRDPESGAQIVLGSRPSGRPTDNLLTGETFSGLIAAARERFDCIILDTPPAGPVVDAFELAAASDLTLFVVKWASQPQALVRATLKALRAATGSVPLRLVLNSRPETKAAYAPSYGPDFGAYTAPEPAE